jgi:hypothetical protein
LDFSGLFFDCFGSFSVQFLAVQFFGFSRLGSASFSGAFFGFFWCFCSTLKTRCNLGGLGQKEKEREKGQKAKSHKGLREKYRLWKTFLDCRGRREKNGRKRAEKSPELVGAYDF